MYYKKMLITAVKSNKILPRADLLSELVLALKKSNLKLREKDILIITSKVVALAQNRVVEGDKAEWIKKEADKVLYQTKHGIITIKDGILAMSAGIDRSNIKDGLILYPKNLKKWTNGFYKDIKKEFKLKKVGLIITDSRSQPLRSGSSAVACAHAGFEGVEFLKGKPDIFGKKLRFSRVNKADMFANAAVVVMGESNEQTPFAIIKNAPVTFTDRPRHPLKVPLRRDIYGNFLTKKKR
ncbi:MAG: coenzyme F420-0:L-glutamate ligase [bacterium]|nr:coenzyme F420-0:L-glutamate ligase [bacterium]